MLNVDDILCDSYTTINLTTELKKREYYLRKINAGVVQEARRKYRRNLPHLLKERKISAGSLNKIFCSAWVNSQEVLFGTKCNKLQLLNVDTGQLDLIPSLRSSSASSSIDWSTAAGIHALDINPSRTRLATGALFVQDLAIYNLSDYSPLCVGELGHKDWIFDIKWVDDEYVVTGSRDSHLCLWKIEDSFANYTPSVSSADCEGNVSSYGVINHVHRQFCLSAEKVRALEINHELENIAVVALNSFFEIYDLPSFKCLTSLPLQHKEENVCISLSPQYGLYAIGSKAHVSFLDARSGNVAIPSVAIRVPLMNAGSIGVRTLQFDNELLTIGTGSASVTFYDVRAQKQLQCHCGHPCSLQISYDSQSNRNPLSLPAVYTARWDNTHSRLFCAGGPLTASLWGNYTGLWM